MNKKLFLLPLVTAFAGSLFAAPLSIGVNFMTTDGQTFHQDMTSGDTAGVIGFSNWNNTKEFSQNSADSQILSGVNDNEGNATTASFNITTDAGGGFLDTYSNLSDNKAMMNGNASTTSIVVSGLESWLTSSGYDVYIYFDSNNDALTQGLGASVTGFSTVFGDDSGDFSTTGSPTFVKAIGTTSGNANNSNYFQFEGLTSNSFTASFSGTASRKAITGIQLVAIPEPSSILLMAGGFAAMLMFRRRKS